LSMLADVVARRTKCTGPTTVIHPPPGSLTPERLSSPCAGTSARTAYTNKRGEPGSSSSLGYGQGYSADNAPVLLTDPHARFHEQQRTRTGNSSSATVASGSEGGVASGNASPPPSLVPQEELRQCGRARLREVDAAGVREALRILDAQFGRR
jgi:YD repeat-containing protein